MIRIGFFISLLLYFCYLVSAKNGGRVGEGVGLFLIVLINLLNVHSQPGSVLAFLNLHPLGNPAIVGEPIGVSLAGRAGQGKDGSVRLAIVFKNLGGFGCKLAGGLGLGAHVYSLMG